MRQRALAEAIRERQRANEPVHRWPLISGPARADWSESYRTVGQFMSTDLFTVRPADLVDLAASVMDWRHIRHVPVEADAGRLVVGLITHRDVLRRAQFFLDFVEAENSMGFHASQEAVRILGESINFTRLGQMELFALGAAPPLPAVASHRQ